jgi:glycine/D-amino acid oxidase-like deaminating enzyme
MKVGRYWPDQLSDGERAALDPGVPSDFNRRPDVLIVGGGIVGLATAVACQRAGIGSVVVVERDQLGSGATGGAGGLLSADTLAGTYPEQYVALGKASIELWWLLQETWPGGVGVTPFDSIKVEPFVPVSARDVVSPGRPASSSAVASAVNRRARRLPQARAGSDQDRAGAQCRLVAGG